jgi:magnesium transporter
MPRTRLYRHGVLELEDFPVADISDYVGDSGCVVWLDLCAPDGDDLKIAASEFGLHELALADAVAKHQRPKVDRYATHSFLNLYTARLDQATGELVTSEVSAFLTHDALITVRKDDGFDVDGLVRHWDENADLAKYGLAYLVWGLLDFVVDGHFDVVQALDEEIEGLEDLVFDERPHPETQRRSFELRKSLVLLRRIVLPMREVVNSLLRRDLGIVSEPMTPYFQDVYDHVLRANEWTESLRDLITTILETHLTVQGNRMNQVMKKVTSWAAIIAVPTAVTGFYGQNVPYPGFSKPSGFWASTVIMIVLSIALYIGFRLKDWI